MSDSAPVLSHLFHILSNCLCSWPTNCDLLGLTPVLVNELTRPLQELNGCSALEAIGFPCPAPPSPAPPLAPSHSKEFLLLKQSFDQAFVQLLSQVVDLQTKVNSSVHARAMAG